MKNHKIKQFLATKMKKQTLEYSHCNGRRNNIDTIKI